MIDRRLHRRVRTNGVRARIRPGHAARVIDVSPDGAQVEAGRQLRPGSLVEVQLEDDERSVRVAARVVRCEATAISPDQGPTYRAGLSFTERCPWVCEQATHDGCEVPARITTERSESTEGGQELPESYAEASQNKEEGRE